MTNDLDFWRSPGPLTDLAAHRSWVDGLPDQPEALRSLVAGLLLHLHWAPAYEVTVTEQGQAENQERDAARIVEAVLARTGGRVDPMPDPASRAVGTCRNFTVLHVSLLRAKGIPARARCGHASYFDTGKWVDHWITEWWDGERDRWIRSDAQIDDFQRPLLTVDLDPRELPDEAFLAGGECWQKVRAGSLDPATCGIADMWGAWFVRSNVIRDLAALNKAELLPWDDWGLASELGEDDNTEGDIAIDEVAAVTATADNLQRLREAYDDDRYRVPPVIQSYRETGPVEVELNLAMPE